jgi:hypothetical protein
VRGPPPRPRQCLHWRGGLLERLPSRRFTSARGTRSRPPATLPAGRGAGRATRRRARRAAPVGPGDHGLCAGGWNRAVRSADHEDRAADAVPLLPVRASVGLAQRPRHHVDVEARPEAVLALWRSPSIPRRGRRGRGGGAPWDLRPRSHEPRAGRRPARGSASRSSITQFADLMPGSFIRISARCGMAGCSGRRHALGSCSTRRCESQRARP